ncbi:hypothetical protein [Rhodoblastus sp.]|uniref:hypothetical protein n=1 Tax=Rhodoblastus sp. TaxID=1962975 RepID=UPI0026306F3F|nr:hypothetical protein [Rhodoblastus sp.]
MRDKSQKTTAENVRPNVSSAAHKFAVGALVTMVGGSERTMFKVTRHLPDGGSGLQYRIKNEGENYERVAIEPLLAPVLR